MKKKEISFNEAISQVEEIIVSIENGEPDIDILSAKVKRASELITLCREKLRETEKKIEDIMQE
jgi:exodeoxyribonuclease VII small subunit